MKSLIIKAFAGIFIYLVWLNLGEDIYESAFLGAFLFLVLIANPLHNPKRSREEKEAIKRKENLERLKTIHERTVSEKKMLQEHARDRKEKRSR